MEKDEGIANIKQICDAIHKAITEKGGNMTIKHEARAVTERDEHDLLTLMQRVEDENREIDGDDDGDQSE
jgi:hypothetical protein